jgi:hypothetical protein
MGRPRAEESCGSVGLQSDAYNHAPMWTRTSQVEKHCNLYITALRQKQNLAQQLGHSREMSTTLSLGELYSSFGLVRDTIPSSCLSLPTLFLNTVFRKTSTLLRHLAAHHTHART